MMQADSPSRTDRERSSGMDDAEDFVVACIYCPEKFRLVHADWCAHEPDPPSKICPRCRRCLCNHPMYHWQHLWHEAPAPLQRHGFKLLFVLYTEWFEA